MDSGSDSCEEVATTSINKSCRKKITKAQVSYSSLPLALLGAHCYTVLRMIHTFFKCGVEMYYKSFIFLSAMTRHDADTEFVL